MQQRAVRLLGCAMVGIGLTGCAVARNDLVLFNPATHHYEAKSPREPILLMSREPDRPYEEIGMILVSGVARLGYESLNDRLRAQARRVGADAVVFVRYGTENVLSLIPLFVAIPYDVLTAEGLAIRFKG